MDTLCRLCSTKTPALTSIFSFKNERLIADMISIICPIKIDPSDSYPKSVCISCLRIIMEAYDLREKSIHSDMNFKTGKLGKFEKLKEVPKKQETMKSAEPPKLPEVASIKVEKDPFNSAIEFVDENFEGEHENNQSENEYDEDNENDDDYYEEIIPLEPSSVRKYKYERVSFDGNTKFKCHLCDKMFSHQTNVNRHIQYDHRNKKSKKDKKQKESTKHKEIGSTSCNICGTYISHKTNLRRHIKMHHPESYISESDKFKSEHLQGAIENSTDLTKTIFGTPKKQKYMEYINIIALDPDNCFRYQCLVCMRETGKSKIWSQSVNNGGTSNIRRHLCSMHPEDFRKFEANTEGME